MGLTDGKAWEDEFDSEEIAPLEPKSKKEMICISKERYEELLDFEQWYMDMCESYV